MREDNYKMRKDQLLNNSIHHCISNTNHHQGHLTNLGILHRMEYKKLIVVIIIMLIIMVQLKLV